MNEPMEIARRHFLGSLGGVGLGSIALAWLESTTMLRATAGDAAVAGAAPSGGPSPIGLPGLPHFAPKAKRVIFLTLSDGSGCSGRRATDSCSRWSAPAG